MAQSFVANANRNLGTGMSAHCKQLADLNTKSATELRELAAYHQKLTSGVPATPPAGGARFERGAGAPAAGAAAMHQQLAGVGRSPLPFSVRAGVFCWPGGNRLTHVVTS